MLKYANDSYKDDYEVLQTFEGSEPNTTSYLIRERHTNRLALLVDCMFVDEETFTREDFEDCAQLLVDYTKD